mmetsp:Transcript_169194/g.325109  ORF Transcript_169194/g.325109 Transcript_169194/m.325109 type:complete len:263 (+) Transcript_169194:2108-2896(+)
MQLHSSVDPAPHQPHCPGTPLLWTRSLSRGSHHPGPLRFHCQRIHYCKRAATPCCSCVTPLTCTTHFGAAIRLLMLSISSDCACSLDCHHQKNRCSPRRLWTCLQNLRLPLQMPPQQSRQAAEADLLATFWILSGWVSQDPYSRLQRWHCNQQMPWISLPSLPLHWGSADALHPLRSQRNPSLPETLTWNGWPYFWSQHCRAQTKCCTLLIHLAEQATLQHDQSRIFLLHPPLLWMNSQCLQTWVLIGSICFRIQHCRVQMN